MVSRALARPQMTWPPYSNTWSTIGALMRARSMYRLATRGSPPNRYMRSMHRRQGDLDGGARTKTVSELQRSVGCAHDARACQDGFDAAPLAYIHMRTLLSGHPDPVLVQLNFKSPECVISLFDSSTLDRQPLSSIWIDYFSDHRTDRPAPRDVPSPSGVRRGGWHQLGSRRSSAAARERGTAELEAVDDHLSPQDRVARHASLDSALDDPAGGIVMRPWPRRAGAKAAFEMWRHGEPTGWLGPGF